MTTMSEPAVSFPEICQPLREQVEAALEATLSRYTDGVPDRLADAMRYSLLGGGKRLRPMLVLLACEACGGDSEHAMPAACAIEMIHTYSLIHDDLPAMDDDALRRGRPTCHVEFDEATAILAGDGLLTLAFEVIAKEVAPDVAAACCADLASASGIAGMVGGQVSDLEAEHCFDPSLELLEDTHRRKTGRLLKAALTLGARIAGASDEIRSSLEKYGECLGLAFQITDDLLDVVGETARMGKEVRKDSASGKLTYPSILGEAESRRKAATLIDEARGCLQPLGEGGRRLESLADFVLERDH